VASTEGAAAENQKNRLILESMNFFGACLGGFRFTPIFPLSGVALAVRQERHAHPPRPAHIDSTIESSPAPASGLSPKTNFTSRHVWHCGEFV
jgi:hypothetical protein